MIRRHIPQRDEVREIELESSHVSISVIFFFLFVCVFFPHHLMCHCGPWATQEPVVKLFTRLTSSFPFEEPTHGPAPLMSDTDFPPAAHPCLSLELSPPLATMISATAGCGAVKPDSILKPKLSCYDFLTHGESDLVSGAERDKLPFLGNYSVRSLNSK